MIQVFANGIDAVSTRSVRASTVQNGFSFKDALVALFKQSQAILKDLVDPEVKEITAFGTTINKEENQMGAYILATYAIQDINQQTTIMFKNYQDAIIGLEKTLSNAV